MQHAIILFLKSAFHYEHDIGLALSERKCGKE